MASCVDSCTFGSAPRNTYQGLKIDVITDPEKKTNIYVSTHKPSSQDQGQDVVFLYSHANSEDLQLCEIWLDDLAQILNSTFVCYDYPGYGETEGRPTEAACRETARHVYQYVR